MMMTIGRIRDQAALWATLAIGLVGCGGSGGGSGYSSSGGGGPVGFSSGSTYVAGTFMPSAQFKGMCAAPRAQNTQDRQGTTLDEQLWLRSWTNELYLWYSEVPDLNPSGYTVASYFNVLKTPAKTASGSDKDKFHFTQDTASYNSFVQSGVQAGYGLDLELLADKPPRKGYVGFTEPGSPAAAQTIPRGAEFISIDGASFVNGSSATLNAGLFPAHAGESHTFVFRYPGATSDTTVTLISANVTTTPVQNVKTIVTGNGTVGYMQFNDHIATSETQLINAVNQLQGVSDLVLDIRYNGGGYLYIASELAYMVAGLARTSGKTFELTQFNSKNPTRDPVTGQTLTPTPFYNTSSTNAALPTLNLSRVFVLTGPGTCSASESIINGLRGANVDVVQIGSTTCGKPYGFYPQDNCGTTYFTIEFKGVNQAGFGDYTDGFSPINTTATLKGVLLPGCSVADDFNHALGDPQEGRLAAALAYRTGGSASCPAATGAAPDLGVQNLNAEIEADSAEAVIAKSPFRENRWLR